MQSVKFGTLCSVGTAKEQALYLEIRWCEKGKTYKDTSGQSAQSIR